MRNLLGQSIFPGTPAQQIGVSESDNRTNSMGRSLGTVKSRTSLFVANSIPAGQTIPIPIAGTQFYVTALTATVSIRPSGGIFNEYEVGTGLQLQEINAFDLLEIRNDNAFPVVFQLFVGFDQFIDKRLILDLVSQPAVTVATYPVPNAATVVNITDLTGQPVTDINGGTWYALARIAICVFNTDTGVTLLLHKANATSSSDPAVAAIFPVTGLNFPSSGDYRLTTGGGNINAVVSEIYQCIPRS